MVKKDAEISIQASKKECAFSGNSDTRQYNTSFLTKPQYL